MDSSLALDLFIQIITLKLLATILMTREVLQNMKLLDLSTIQLIYSQRLKKSLK